MAVMGKNAGIVRLWIIAAVILCLLSDCTPEEDVSGAANVTTTFKLKSPSAMEGKITIREVYLKLDRIQVTGSLNGETNTDLTHPVPAEDPPYQLSRADSSHVSFSLPAHVYDQLNFNLYLLQDNYELTFQSPPVEEIPDPVEENDDQNGGNQPDNGGDENGDGDGDGDSENGNDGGSDDDGESNDDEDEDSGDNGNSGDDDNGDADDGDDAGSDNDEGKDENKGDKDDDKKGDKGKDDDKNKGEGKDDKDDDDKEDEEDDDGRTADKQNANVVDLDHFFQNAKPGMVILATYEDNGKFTNIIFVAAGIENFSIQARQDDSFNIVLTEQNTAQVTFDPQSWFEGLSTADIESANRQIHQQQEVIFIHPGFNVHLFEILAPRLAESADLNFAPY